MFAEGGVDSKIFVAELYDAYCKYAERHQLKVELLARSDGHILALIKGKNAWEIFKNESGKHCIQRVPPTENRGRKQTSMVLVGILPIKKDVAGEPLLASDIEVTTQCGKQGAGGQHVNKSQTAVRMKHKPTGLSVFINGRSQEANYKEALKILTARVNDANRMKVDAEYATLRRSQMGDGSRSGKTRTYNTLESRVVDHRLGTKTHNVKAVLEKGQFDLLFEVDKS